MTLVYEGKHGFVTDAGEPIRLTRDDGQVGGRHG
jgi:hypothetical protein